MMEAIRLSLAAEEERKRRDDKDAAKEAKKEGKKKAKENKKVAKAQRNVGSGFHPINVDGLEDSAGGSSAAGKGKAVDRSGGSVGFNPMNEPTSTINTGSSKDDAQRHLEDSRAHIQEEARLTWPHLMLLREIRHHIALSYETCRMTPHPPLPTLSLFRMRRMEIVKPISQPARLMSRVPVLRGSI